MVPKGAGALIRLVWAGVGVLGGAVGRRGALEVSIVDGGVTQVFPWGGGVVDCAVELNLPERRGVLSTLIVIPELIPSQGGWYL